MSMKSQTEPGYGFELFNGKNLNKIKDFLIQNQEVYAKEPLADEDIEDIRDAEDEFDLADYFDDPVPWVVAQIIRAKEGECCGIKGYQSDGDTDQEAMLGIGPSYPWQTQYRTKEECDALLKRYADILGIDEEPDFFDAEYYG